MNNLVRGLFYHAYEVTLSFQTPAMTHSINGQILNFFFFSIQANSAGAPSGIGNHTNIFHRQAVLDRPCHAEKEHR